MQTLGEILVIFDLARVRSLGRAAQRSASHPRRRIGRGGCVLSAGAPRPRGQRCECASLLSSSLCVHWLGDWVADKAMPVSWAAWWWVARLPVYLPTYLVQPASIDLFNPTVRGPSIRSCVLSIWGRGVEVACCRVHRWGEKKETQDDT